MISLLAPHPNLAKGGGLHKFPPPLMGRGEVEEKIFALL